MVSTSDVNLPIIILALAYCTNHMDEKFLFKRLMWKKEATAVSAVSILSIHQNRQRKTNNKWFS